MQRYMLEFWNKTNSRESLTFFERLFFYFLCLCETGYRAGFFFVTFYKKLTRNRSLAGPKVISVGNLTVGGTGKSVVVSFLAAYLHPLQGAIVLRGYRGQGEKAGGVTMVGDGSVLHCGWQMCGDEAFMLASQLPLPVFVGKNRFHVCSEIVRWAQQEKKLLNFILLDDAYQNFDVKKDVEILLLDARKPFDNDHCLPAGRLREKDYSRADVIFLTHSDRISTDSLMLLVERLHNEGKPVFTGKHSTEGIFLNNEGFDEGVFMRDKKAIVFAGIGSISGFIESVKNYGLAILSVHNYEDHYAYSQQDVEQLAAQAFHHEALLITTAKDWVKIKPLLAKINYTISMYVLRVSFAFLSEPDYDRFGQLMKRMLS